MGLYTRTNSPCWWVRVTPPGRPCIRISTRIPIDGGAPWQTAQNKRLAQEFYAIEMGRLAIERMKEATDPPLQPRPAPTLPKSPDGWCYVYFLREGEAVKIGRAKDLKARYGTLATANRRGLELLVAVPAHAALEDALHKRFKYLRTNGEWFSLAPELVQFIEQLRTGTNPVALLFDQAE